MDNARRVRFHNLPILITVASILTSLAVNAKAIDLRYGRTVSLATGEVVSGNLYVAAEDVFVSGNVDGDLTAAAGSIYIDGTVTHDITVGAGRVQLNGKVGGDFRVAGGQVDVAGKIDRDLVIAAGTVRILPSAFVGGDVIVAGGNVSVEGTLARSLKAVAGQIVLNGSVAGPVGVRTAQLAIGNNAKLGSELTYFSPQETHIGAKAKVAGPVMFHVISGMDQDWLRIILRRFGVAFFFLRFLMTLGAGLVGYLLLPIRSQALVRYALSNFWREVLRGFLLFFIIPPALFLIFITVVGAPVAFLGGLTLLSVGIIAIIYSGIALGTLLLKRLRRQREYIVSWQAVLIGIPLAFLVRLVPYAGFLFNATFFLAVFGSLYKRFWVLLRGEPASGA
jgi:cytoskeletal protein CcmA (bactofilin family)